MRRATLLVLCAFFLVAFSGCKVNKGIAGSGNRQTETRELKPFKAIDTNGAYEVDVTCQKPARFEIEADDNILPLIKTEVRDGILFVTSDESYRSSRSVSLRISVPELVAFSSRGAGKVNVTDASGDDLKIESRGAASVEAAGTVKNLTISSTGAGDIKTGNLRTQNATVQVTGAASVDVYATDQLDVTVSGVGSVNYSGNPKKVNKNVTGFGSVNKKGD
jgi:hypothetical protein